jgi:hypothetical protein
MKIVSILAASVILAVSATASFAQGSYSPAYARNTSGDAYAGSPMSTGRSVSVTPAPLENCQTGEPSVSPNGIAPLDDLGVCHSNMSLSR